MKQPVGCVRDAEKERALAEAEGHLVYCVARLHTHDHQHMSRPAAAGYSWMLPFWHAGSRAAASRFDARIGCGLIAQSESENRTYSSATFRRSTRRCRLEYVLIHIKRVTDHSLSNDLATERGRPNFTTLDCRPAERNRRPVGNYSGAL